MATEKRLIDANALIRKSIAVQAPRTSLTLLPGQQWMDTVHAVLVTNIMSAPTVDAVEVVHGQWIRKPIGKYTGVDEVCCSVCGCFIGVVSSDTAFIEAIEGVNYCLNCGAKMDGGADNGL